jgi:hypothetical protein
MAFLEVVDDDDDDDLYHFILTRTLHFDSHTE